MASYGFAPFGSKSTAQKKPTDEIQHSQAQAPQQQSAPASAPAPTQAPTFANLQQQGVARPAPPTMFGSPNINMQSTQQPPQTGGFTPGGQQTGGFTPGGQPGGQPGQPGGFNLSQLLQQQLGYGLQNPSAYSGDVVMDAYERMNRELGQGFDVERQFINEDAARRGLHFSTIPVGRLGDVGIRQAQAQSDLGSRLLQDQARTYGQDRASIINQAMGYGQNQFGNQLDTARFNQQQDLANQQLMLAILGYT